MSASPANDKRRALGKGLESLLPSRSATPAPPPPQQSITPTPQESTGKPREIAVDAIDRNPYQTRTRFDEEALNELSQSIAATTGPGRVTVVPAAPLHGDMTSPPVYRMSVQPSSL